MAIVAGTGSLNENPDGSVFFHRRLFVTDKDGIEREILTDADMQAILDQMTPQQLEEWKTRYRFAPIINLTGNPNYTGTFHDL